MNFRFAKISLIRRDAISVELHFFQQNKLRYFRLNQDYFNIFHSISTFLIAISSYHNFPVHNSDLVPLHQHKFGMRSFICLFV